ncbi:AraC family transcriptional regulator [Varunaivibrio sulfuroxidans]|uniref:AraC family transcriptional regulator n=1 Tax=Varunaivibrio sulfuroxidans TaxID=1773489 RepID=A0A4R3JD16_9PROT|nr:helix-turn-helix transcriptional regulator [Varunaivibrio sulfuroxidans]TCS63043.1 AraC family transcriptional regulator [Varunaivibrio sulfuroxidans]WES31882.1 helix-turn-helix transcriptional regulator [Varunaivibrio sulfuroxidans]
MTKNIEKEPSTRINAIPGVQLDADDIPRPVVVRVTTLERGQSVPTHAHARAQLVYAAEGVVTVATPSGIWVAPPSRAVWVAPDVEHSVRASSRAVMNNLFLVPALARQLALPSCCVVAVPDLLRTLLAHGAQMPTLYEETGPDGRIVGVIVDQIRILKTQPLHLPAPSDPRLKIIADALIANPADKRTLAQWARVSGASTRTLARLFPRQTGMNFAQWRQQARLLEALRRLAHKQPVTTIALDLGYDSPSAFIAIFKKAMGATPGKYFDGAPASARKRHT